MFAVFSTLLNIIFYWELLSATNAPGVFHFYFSPFKFINNFSYLLKSFSSKQPVSCSNFK